MLPSLLASVMGTSSDTLTVACQMTPATLPGHTRLSVKWADFPAVVPCSSTVNETDAGPITSVKGFLVFGLTGYERMRLDRYEGGLYDLTEVEVEIDVLKDEAGTLPERATQESEKRMLNAEVYVWGGERDELCEVDEKEWSLEKFLKSDMARRWNI